MIGELCDASGIARRQVYTVTLAGNTTMQQLFCGIDPVAVGRGAVRAGDPARALSLPAEEGGLEIHPRGRIYVLPIIGAFVGGDIAGGILATGLAESSGPTMLIDIGTNGEIVLAADGKLDGNLDRRRPGLRRGTDRARHAGLPRGDRKGRGRRPVADPRHRPRPARGTVRFGLDRRDGRTAAAWRSFAARPAGWRATNCRRASCRTSPRESSRATSRRPLCSADGSPKAAARRSSLTQRDIREVQLASGAIRAGIELLLKRHGLRPADLDRVLLAGGFGNYIRRSNAQRIGLLPPEIPHQRIRYHGNTSLAGARLAALSMQCRRDVRRFGSADRARRSVARSAILRRPLPTR